MATHRTRVGVHARNDVTFTEADYALVRLASIETLKTMSHTAVSVYERLRRENPRLEFIVRLYDDRVRNRSRPDPASFVQRMVPIIQKLKPYATKFEIHNEPNHVDGIEGWGASDADARAFLSWYMTVLQGLRKACPWAKFGFPGLAPHHPHRDLEWLDLCRKAVEASDWLGCHCYWQYGNMLSGEWGLRFKLYHQRFPGKTIEITEFGNSTPDLPPAEMARQYVAYYQELNKYYYLGSASAFIASSPDPAWAPFAWIRDGKMQPVVQAVGNMERKPVEVAIERLFKKTGKKVRGNFLEFFDEHGLEFCGYPITDQFVENGVPTQYFERLALEEPKRGQVQLKPIGTQVLALRKQIAELEAAIQKLSVQPLPTTEGVIDGLSDVTEVLAAQIQALRQEQTRLEEAGEVTDDSRQSLLEQIGRQIGALEELNSKLHQELAAALQAMGDAQAILVEQLQEQVKALEDRVKELEAQRSAAAPSPPAAIDKPQCQYLVDRLPKHSTEQYARRPRSQIKQLVIHHSATAAEVTPEAIARYHVNSWQWPGIGYHFLVAKDGTVSQTNELETVSYHAATVNAESVGLCFLGNFMKESPTDGQLQAGAHLIAWLLQELSLGPEAVQGHRELMSTSCPGDQWLAGAEWKKQLMARVAQMRG